MTKTITIRELTELLHAQEAEIREEFGARQKALIAENERLSLLLAEKFKVIDDLTERLEKVKTQVKDKVPAPHIVGVLECSPCIGNPVDITEQFDYSKIPCLGDDDVCVSCGS